MKMTRVLSAFLALMLVATQAAYAFNALWELDVSGELDASGTYTGGPILVEAEFKMDDPDGMFERFEGDPANSARLWIEFYRSGTKADALPDGTFPELVRLTEEVLWERTPLLPEHTERIWRVRERLTPPAGSVHARISYEFTIGWMKMGGGEHNYPLAELTKPIDEGNQNPTVQQPVISPSDVTTATKTIAVAATASDPDGDELTYTWYVNGVPVAGPTPNLNGIEIPKLERGEYTVRVKVEDGRGDPATAEAMFKVGKEKNEPPEADLNGPTRATPRQDPKDPKSPTLVGKSFYADADDPDGDNKELRYEWWTGELGGPLTKRAEGSGRAAAGFVWAPIPPGLRYVVEVRITDGDGAVVVKRSVFDMKDDR